MRRILCLGSPAPHESRVISRDLVSAASGGQRMPLYSRGPSPKRTFVDHIVCTLRDNAGNEVGSFLVLHNVTDQVEADKALREREAKYHILAEAMPHFVWESDAAGCPDFASEKWYAYTGLTPEESKTGWTNVHHPEDLPNVRAAWEQALHDGHQYEAESRIRCLSDGAYHWFRCRGAPVRQTDGSIMCWVGTFTNIDGQKRAEQRLQEADDRKDEFLAMLGHELRNPLAPIRHALEILKCVSAGSNPQIADLQQMMARQVEHLVHLVDDLLDVSRIMRGRIELRREEVLLSSVISRAIEAVRPLLDTYRHDLCLELPPESVTLFGDTVRLAQVISNLLSNAAKYTPP